MTQRYVERYLGFEIVIDVVATGDLRIRIAQRIIRQAAYRFTTVVDFDEESRRVFLSVKDAISTVVTLARDKIDALVWRGSEMLH